MIISFTPALPTELNITYELDFQYDTTPLVWTSLDVTVIEALDTLKTGLLNNKPVAKIKLFAIVDTDIIPNVSMEFVYDVRAAKQGNIPWSLEQTTLSQTT